MTKRKIDMRSEVYVRLRRRTATGIILESINERLPSSLKIEWDLAVPTREARLPLWELMRIFGPHISTSVALPFIEFEVDVEDHELDAAVRRGERAEGALYDLLGAIGEDVRGMAPELFAKAAQAYINEEVEARPGTEGYWWLGDDVVRVRWFHGHLCVLRGNRYKPVGELDGWGGPAIRDARVKNEDDEDIPF